MAIKKQKIRSPEYKERHREINRRWRERMIAEGLCTRCGKEKAAEGHRLCESCRAKSKKETHESIKRARITGRCVKCRKNWALPHMRICLPCKLKAQEWQEKNAYRYTYAERKEQFKEKRERYKAQGKCVSCGRPTDGVHTRCPACMERQRQSSRKSWQRKKERMKNEVG